MAVLTIVAHGRAFPQRYLNVDDRYFDLDTSAQVEIWIFRKGYLNIGHLGHLEKYDPQGRPIIVIVVIITIVLANTPTMNDRKVGGLAVNGRVHPKVLLPFRVRCLAGRDCWVVCDGGRDCIVVPRSLR
jgi:hypothetical protein